MKLNLIQKILPTEMILDLGLTVNPNVMKGSCLEFFFVIFTCTSTLRQWITYVYVFQLLFDFFSNLGPLPVALRRWDKVHPTVHSTLIKFELVFGALMY